MRAIHESLDPFAVTPIRDEIIRRALSAQGLDAIPEDGDALSAFVAGSLREAIISLFDRDIADTVVRTLGPVVGRASRSHSSGLRKRVTPDADGTRSDRIVLCVGSDEQTVAELRQHLTSVARVVCTDDTLTVRETVEGIPPAGIRVIIDTRHKPMRAGRTGAIARQLPAGTRVMVWGADESETRLMQTSRADLDWLPVGTEAGVHDIATLCTVSGVSGARMRPLRRPILVVDHDASARRALADTLAAMGHPVMTAATGAEALALCSQRMPRLVLADQELPGMTGVEMAQLLHRAGGGETPPIVVMVTDLLSGDDMSGIDAAIPKAMIEEKLESIFSRLLVDPSGDD